MSGRSFSFYKLLEGLRYLSLQLKDNCNAMKASFVLKPREKTSSVWIKKASSCFSVSARWRQ